MPMRGWFLPGDALLSTLSDKGHPILTMDRPNTDDGAARQRLRITFRKGPALRFISHLDLARTWERAFRRARLPVSHSKGYNPRPRFQIAAALPVGVTGQAELLDVWLDERLEPESLASSLRRALPPGLEVMHAEEVELRSPSLQSMMRAAEYQVLVHSPEPVDGLRSRVQALLAETTLLRRREHKGGWQTYDLRPLIQSVVVDPGPEGIVCLHMRLQASPAGAGRPDEVLDALGLSLTQPVVERTKLRFEFDK